MSVEFELKPTRLDQNGWNDALRTWAESNESMLYDEPALEDCGDGDFAVHLMCEGSTRGVSLVLEPEAQIFRVRLNALASRADWRMAYQILKTGMEYGGGSVEREDGTSYSTAMLCDAQAESDAATDFCFCARATVATMREQNSPVTLPIGGYAVTLTVEDLDNCTAERQPGIEQALAERIDTYASAFKASVMELQGGGTLSTWALIPTLMQKVDHVMIDYGDILVPLEAVQKVLGDRCEVLGESVYLPAMDRTADKATLDELAAHAIDMKPPEAADGDDGDEPLSEEEEADANGAFLYMVSSGIAACVLRDEDLESEKKNFIDNGFDTEMVEGAVQCSLMILKDLLQMQKSPEEATTNLVQHGIPQDVSEVLVMGVCKALQEHTTGGS